MSSLRIQVIPTVVAVLAALCFHWANSEFLTKKICRDVETPQCAVHSVQLAPCPHAPAFCTVKRGKRYTLTMDFTPAFPADRLALSMSGDLGNNGTFSQPVKSPGDACSMLTCPVEAGVRRIFDVDFQLDKSYPFAKFPLKVKVWSEEDDSKSCCFTFNVKVHK